MQSSHYPTFPCFVIRFASFLLICLSILVSPLDMRRPCHIVRAPMATPTVLRKQKTAHFFQCQSGHQLTPPVVNLISMLIKCNSWICLGTV